MPLLYRRKRSSSAEPSTPTAPVPISRPTKLSLPSRPSAAVHLPESPSNANAMSTTKPTEPMPGLTRATLAHMRTGSIPVITSSGVPVPRTGAPVPGSSKGKERERGGERDRGRERHREKEHERKSEQPPTAATPLYARFARSAERQVADEERDREARRAGAEQAERERRREERRREKEREREKEKEKRRDGGRLMKLKPESPLSTLERRTHRDAQREREREKAEAEAEVERAKEREERRRRRREMEKEEEERRRAKEEAWRRAREGDRAQVEAMAEAHRRQQEESQRRAEEDAQRRYQEEVQRRQQEHAQRQYEAEMQAQRERMVSSQNQQSSGDVHDRGQADAENRRRQEEEMQRRQHEREVEAHLQHEMDIQSQRERTLGLQSQAPSVNDHDRGRQDARAPASLGRRTSSRAPAPFRSPSSVPSNTPGTSPGGPLPDYAPLAAHLGHHHYSPFASALPSSSAPSTTGTPSPMHTYPPVPGPHPPPSPQSSQSYSSQSFDNARGLGRRHSNMGPPLSPSARHGERMYGYGGHHRSASSGASVAGGSVHSHGLPTPPSSTSSAIGQASRPGSVQAPLASAQHQQLVSQPSPQHQEQSPRSTSVADLPNSPSKASIEKPLPTPGVPRPTIALNAVAAPPPTVGEPVKPRRKYSLLAAFGLKSKAKEEDKRAQPPLQQSASAAQPVPMIARTPSNKSDLRRSSTQTPSRTPSYQQVPVIPRALSGSHPSVHQVFQHPSPPGSQVHMYAPQTPGHAYGHGHQQNAPRHAHSPPQSTPPSATPSRATSPRAVHRKSPPAYHSQPQQNMSALSLHSAGSLTGHGQAQPSPSIQASLASGSASSSALSPTSSGVVSLLPGSTSATQLPQARSRPDVSSTSGHGHERLQEEAQIAESRIPPHPPQSVLSEDDHRLSRMALLQPRLPQTQPMTQMAEHEPIMKEAEASPPPTHGLDVPQGVDVDGDRTPSPAPAQSQSQSHHAALAPVQGKPRIFATVNTDEVADEPRPEQATSKLSPEWDYEDGQRVQEPEASLVRGKPRILAAQADGDTGLEAVGREKAEPAQPDILYTQHTGAYSQPADAYTEPRHLEEELEQEATGIVRDYPHTHGYPTPRSRSPVLLVDRVPTDSARGREEQRSGPREGDMEGRRVSRSLPPTPSPRAPSPEPHPDTDVERADGNDRRRLKKLRKVIGSSQSDEEGEDRRRGHHFGLRKGLGIFGFKTLTERQVGKLGTRDAAAPLETQGGASASGSMPIATVQRSASESDGRRKLRKDSRRGRREDRSEEGTNQREHEQDINEDSGFVHVDASEIQEEMQRGRTGPWAPPTPVTPEDYARARAQRRGTKLSKPLPALNVQTQAPLEPQEPPKPSQPYPLVRHLLEPTMLAGLLTYLTYSEWLGMARLCRAVREGVAKDRELTECVLEQFLGAVGYSRWMWGLDPSAAKEKSRERSGERQERMKPAGEAEPMVLTLQDLNAYMRGVSMPSHQYGNLASEYLRARGDPHQLALMGELAACCRAYTRIVLRLRAQAEAEARFAPPVTASSPTAPNFPPAHRTPSLARGSSRGSSRAPSVSVSHAASTQAPVRAAQSPLFRLRRAPLLQVFVPSPGGDWLSDDSVLACEEELNKAGAIRLMRAGDVVWDVAVGDEGNIGRMVWDGSYLIDLDYAWSRIGDLPRYLPTLAFPPSYFHRVIRTQGSGNPICHIDIAPWGGEIASNLQLLQDRMKTETPQGSHHTVVRWVHRSSFTVIPSTPNKPIRIPPMPNVGPGPNHGVWYVDPGWYGRIVVEAEGTNEGVADLQMRCRGAFPPRAVGARPGGERGAHAGNNVFRILRERSRPGEIWIRTVRDKERLVPR